MCGTVFFPSIYNPVRIMAPKTKAAAKSGPSPKAHAAIMAAIQASAAAANAPPGEVLGCSHQLTFPKKWFPNCLSPSIASFYPEVFLFKIFTIWIPKMYLNFLPRQISAWKNFTA